METGLMKLALVLVVSSIFLLRGSVANASPPDEPEISADTTDLFARDFNSLAQEWMHAYNRGDSSALTAMYTEDAEYISGHVKGLEARGRDRVIANFQNGVRSGGHVDSVTILSIQQSCDLATLLCRYEATNSGQKAIGRNLLVVKRVNNRWLIVMHMTVV